MAAFQSPRKAATPAKCHPNYSYAILEAEARIAVLAPDSTRCWASYMPTRSRDSLVFDVLELVRPVVGAFLLDF